MATLKHLAIKGASWTLLGYGIRQMLRFGSNILLTRFLFPEAFGLSALISAFMIGLVMFSDIGIGPSIIQNERGDEPTFLNTAWTIQVFRGFALWGCSCLLAYPFSLFYGEPLLFQLIVVSGCSSAILGLSSTGIYTANKHLKLKKLTLIELGSQVVAITVMLIWVKFDPSVWALVAGGLAHALSKMLGSHLWLSTVRHRLCWDKSSVNELIKFGRWIFLSTILSFAVNHIDRLVVGKFLDLEFLGIFSIALMISKATEEAFRKLGRQVLFPVYSKIRNEPHQEVLEKVKKIRIALMSSFVPILVMLVVIGPEIIQFCFDSRYHDAGWMVQILSLGRLITVCTEIGPIYLAYGDSGTMLKLVAIKAILLITLMILGGVIWSGVGLIIGISVSRFFFYPFYARICQKYELWIVKYDVIGIFASTLLILLGFSLKFILIN